MKTERILLILALLTSTCGRPVADEPDQLQSPTIPFGVASGDVSRDRAVIWSRSDRPSRMIVDYGEDEELVNTTRVIGPAALELSDYTAKTFLTQLQPGTLYHYRVSFQSLEDLSLMSQPAAGRFQTAPDQSQEVRFAWSGDTAGQGWGINEADGGMRTYEAIRKLKPDFFIHSGDMIYADNPIEPEVTLDDGSIWRNLTTPEKSKVAETLDEFRGNFRYNLLDANVRRFNAEVPLLVQWDDHETINNWYPDEPLLTSGRYTRVRSVALLAAHGRQAFLEYNPVARHPQDHERIYRNIDYGPDIEVFLIDLRSYRASNSLNQQDQLGADTAILGTQQRSWLADSLTQSTATWKIVASDMPLGLIINDSGIIEGVANSDGPPRGRELEIAQLLATLKANHVHNVVWLTADVHYAAAHFYDPSQAQFSDFNAFWEFVSGPLHAGNFGPNTLDNTFGPQLKFLSIPEGLKSNRPPSEGYQFFGHVIFRPKTKALTVEQRNRAGEVLYSVELKPQP